MPANLDQMFVVIAPQDDPGDYLQAMQQVSRLVQNRDFRRFMLGVKNKREVMGLIKEMAD